MRTCLPGVLPAFEKICNKNAPFCVLYLRAFLRAPKTTVAGGIIYIIIKTMNILKNLYLSGLVLAGICGGAQGAVISPLPAEDSSARPQAEFPAALGADGKEITGLDTALTLARCLEIAMENNPSLISARLNVADAAVSVSLAKSKFLPTATAGAQQDYNVTKLPGHARTDHGSASSYVEASLTISGITDLARNVKTANLALEQAKLALEKAEQEVASNVKSKFYTLLSAQKAVEIRTKARDLYQDQYNRAQAYFENGLRPKVDVTTAEVNLNNEDLRLIRAKNLVNTSSANLANAMGVTAGNTLVLDSQIDETPFQITLEEAVRTAYAQRPDVLSSQTGLKISRIKLNQAKAGYWPTFSFSASFSKSGDDFYLDNENTKLLAAVELPLFNALQTYNGVKQAKISLAGALNQDRSLMNDVFLQVQSAYLKLQEAGDSVPIAQLNVQKAKENLDLAQGRYNEGIGDIIELKDAEVSYTDAELSYLTARYDYATAVAELKQAMGTK